MESIFQKTGDSCQRKRHIEFIKAHHFTPVPIRSPTQATNIVKPSHQHDFIVFLIFGHANRQFLITKRSPRTTQIGIENVCPRCCFSIELKLSPARRA